MTQFKPQLQKELHTIDVAKIEISDMIHIRRLNILSAFMGSSGLVFDQVVLAENAMRYRKKAGNVIEQAMEQFQTSLLQSLKKQGYTIRYSNKPFWDYFKPSENKLRSSSDGILRIQFRQQGFLSQGPQSDYRPTVFISVELLHPQTREILYSDQFASGFTEKDLKYLSFYFGKTRMMKNPEGFSFYKNVDQLLEQSDKSKKDFLSTIRLSAQHIAYGLKRPSSKALALSEEINSHPSKDTKTTVKSSTQRAPLHLDGQL